MSKTVKAKLFTDGGARGNPGPAGIGGVLKIEGKKTLELSEYIGETTNNQAEYKAFIAGMKLAKDNNVTDLVCYLDSELVVKQIKGEYRVRDAGLKVVFKEAQGVIALFDELSVEHVLRAKNKQADRLVNLAIDRNS